MFKTEFKSKSLFYIAALIICYIGQSSNAQIINENWVKMDSLFINSVKQAHNSNPLSIEKLIEPWEKAQVNLGYGYSIIEQSMGKGYVSIFYTCIYQNNKLISYKLEPKMPHDSELTHRYLSFYNGLFNVENNHPQDLYFNYEDMYKPINKSKNTISGSSEFRYLMTPYSGVIYGDFGSDQALENRKAYNAVKDSISEEKLVYLLQSINSSTRLCAAEHYFKNKKLYSQKSKIEKLIQDNYKELPTIQIMSVDLILDEDAKEVVTMMIKRK